MTSGEMQPTQFQIFRVWPPWARRELDWRGHAHMKMWCPDIAQTSRMPVVGKQFAVGDVLDRIHVSRNFRAIHRSAEATCVQDHRVIEPHPVLQIRRVRCALEKDHTWRYLPVRYHAQTVGNTDIPTAIQNFDLSDASESSARRGSEGLDRSPIGCSGQRESGRRLRGHASFPECLPASRILQHRIVR